MTRTLRHRGPDDEGLLIRDGVALGHRRLAVIDRVGGAQPMRRGQDGPALVFNGEIYNHREIARSARAQGLLPRTRCDTESILLGYAAWGDRCVERLDGMFAFALHDPARRRVLAARDRFGEKPLYYVHRPDLFAFASEPAALLAHPAVRRSIDPSAIARYMLFEHVPAPRSIWRGVRVLPAAHRLVLDLTSWRLDVERYWTPACPEPPERDERVRDGEWVARVRTALERAVERRMHADVPVGVLLSGGLDSAAIAAILARRRCNGGQCGDRVPTFTIGFEDPRFDESARARAVAAHLGTTHHELVLQPGDVSGVLETLATHLDEPIADPAILPTYALARLARGSVTVALGGDGGDELFGGYQTFAALRAAALYDAVVPDAGHARLRRALEGRLRPRYGYFSADFRLERFLRGMKCPRGQRLWRWLGATTPEELAGLVEPDAFTAGDLDGLYADVERLHAEVAGRDAVTRDSRVYLGTYLPDGLMTRLDRAAMACSLETRCPLLDPELVRLAAEIPGRLKVRRGRGKHVLRRAVADLLPAETLRARKHGFALPVGAWLRGPWRSDLLDTLGERAIRDGGLFRPAAVKRLVDDHLDGRRDNRKPLFALFMLERWRRAWCASASTPREAWKTAA